MKYFTIIERSQFNYFYKFGYTHFLGPRLIATDDNIDSKELKHKLFELLLNANKFEYYEEYLILELEAQEAFNKECMRCKFNIQDIVKVYALTEQSQKVLQRRLDTRIEICNADLDIYLSEMEFFHKKQECKDACRAVFKICGVDDDSDSFLSAFGDNDLIEAMRSREQGVKPQQLNADEANYLFYLYAYDRYEYFHKTTIGYFFDAALLFAYSQGKASLVGSKIHRLLSSIDINSSSKDIINLLQNSDDAKSFVELSDKWLDKSYIISALFFKLKDELRKSDDVAATSLVKESKFYLEQFGEEFKYVLVLLACFFGYDKFYDAYYDCIDLKFYKAKAQVSAVGYPAIAAKAKILIDKVLEFVSNFFADNNSGKKCKYDKKKEDKLRAYLNVNNNYVKELSLDDFESKLDKLNKNVLNVTLLKLGVVEALRKEFLVDDEGLCDVVADATEYESTENIVVADIVEAQQFVEVESCGNESDIAEVVAEVLNDAESCEVLTDEHFVVNEVDVVCGLMKIVIDNCEAQDKGLYDSEIFDDFKEFISSVSTNYNDIDILDNYSILNKFFDVCLKNGKYSITLVDEIKKVLIERYE